jgi:hypothetical protein
MKAVIKMGAKSGRSKGVSKGRQKASKCKFCGARLGPVNGIFLSPGNLEFCSRRCFDEWTEWA